MYYSDSRNSSENSLTVPTNEIGTQLKFLLVSFTSNF